MAILFKNNAASTLSSIYISSTGKFSDLYVADSSVFPSITAGTGDYFYLTLVGDDTLEIVKAFETGTNSSGDKYIRVYRAQEDTVQQDWPAGTRVEMRITADALNSFVPTAVQIAKDNVDAIGVASTTNVGFAGVDGKTTQADAEGVITVKDVAINGNLEDLASARGQIGNLSMYSGDANLKIDSGTWGITSITASDPDLNYPIPERNSGRIGILTVLRREIAALQRYEALSTSLTGGFVYERLILNPGKAEQVIGNWVPRIAKTGDGITNINGVISVPEMEGATASANGVSGLVPPPLKADLGKSLGADGEWTYPADVAIGDNQADLASARGQIGNPVYTDAVDFNTYTKAGFYSLKNVDAAENKPPVSVNGHLIVHSDGTRIRQIYYRIGTINSNDWHMFTRSGASGGTEWSDWIAMLTERNLGDGLKFSNYKVSVPEYEGATASSAGTSGLVPPAAAGEENFVLHGDGTFRPATPSWEVLNNFRKSMIGISFPFPSTTLPEGFVWADGSLILFEDYPEVKEKYEAGGFDGMLLAWDADEQTIAANLGKWRPNAATPTGVYTPSLKGRFSCAWVPDDVTDAGSSAPDTGRGLTGSWITGWEDGYVPTIQTTGALYLKSFSAAQRQGTTITTVTQPFQVLFDASRVWGEEHTGQAFAPAHIQQPYAIYLGVPA